MKNQIDRIQVDVDHNGDPVDVIFYFQESSEPFSASEFTPGSQTRKALDIIEEICLYGASVIDNIER